MGMNWGAGPGIVRGKPSKEPEIVKEAHLGRGQEVRKMFVPLKDHLEESNGDVRSGRSVTIREIMESQWGGGYGGGYLPQSVQRGGSNYWEIRSNVKSH